MEKKIGPPSELNKISGVTWELPVSYKDGMKVPGRVIANDEIMKSMEEGLFNQLSNVANLPGIQKYAICMPDGHIICG
jgi:tRNA-splicing ligase RtcB (3'-phosphate/5'-hydroxy nucleic acid ligase)